MTPSTTTYVCLAIGIIALAFSVWERRGKGRSARSWTDGASEGILRFHLFVVPGIGILALVLGLAPWYDDLPALFGLLVGIAVLIGFVVLFVWGILQFPYPRWTVPNWARTKIAERFDKEAWLR